MKVQMFLSLATLATLLSMPMAATSFASDDSAQSTLTLDTTEGSYSAEATDTTDSADNRGGGGFHGGGAVHAGRPAPVARPVRPVVRPAPVIPHPVHVHGPIIYRGGPAMWRHWAHPFFVRPVYAFNWYYVHAVTCTATDSYGEQFPVTRSDYVGIAYQANIAGIEDLALDRCYAESNGDAGCRLVTCVPTY